MRKMMLVAVIAFVVLGNSPDLQAQNCICRIENPDVSVNNFPDVQKVAIDTSLGEPMEVKETDLQRTFSVGKDIGTAEKVPFGPFPLDGRTKALIQISQTFPKSGTPPPLIVKWYVRFNDADPFFDPCLKEKSDIKEPHACSTGFPPVGAKLRPLMPATMADELEGFTIAPAHAGIAALDIVGTEALLVVENTGAAPRAIRVNLVLNR